MHIYSDTAEIPKSKHIFFVKHSHKSLFKFVWGSYNIKLCIFTNKHLFDLISTRSIIFYVTFFINHKSVLNCAYLILFCFSIWGRFGDASVCNIHEFDYRWRLWWEQITITIGCPLTHWTGTRTMSKNLTKIPRWAQWIIILTHITIIFELWYIN